MSAIDAAMAREFGVIAELIRLHAKEAPSRPALVDSQHTLDYGTLDALMDRIAASLQRDGLRPGDAIAICAASSTGYAALFLGALRAGIAVAPLAPSSTPASLARMIEDAQAQILFIDAPAAQVIGASAKDAIPRIALDDSEVGQAFEAWLAPAGSQPIAVKPQPPGPSTSSIPPAPPANPRGSCRATACAGPTCSAARSTATAQTP